MNPRILHRAFLLGGLVVVTITHNVNAFASIRSSANGKKNIPSPAERRMTKRHALGVGWEALDSWYETFPYCAAFVTCSFKASAADLVAQTQSSNNEQQQEQPNTESLATLENSQDSYASPSFDFLRNLAFILYGGFYQGMGQTFLYADLYPSLFGTTPTLQAIIGQAGMENFVLAPFFCLPTVYSMRALVKGETILDGLTKYVQHISSQQLLFRYWSIWFPVQCLNFAVIRNIYVFRLGHSLAFSGSACCLQFLLQKTRHQKMTR